MSCCRCMTTEPELAIGKCPLKDDMAKLLELYIQKQMVMCWQARYMMYR